MDEWKYICVYSTNNVTVANTLIGLGLFNYINYFFSFNITLVYVCITDEFLAYRLCLNFHCTYGLAATFRISLNAKRVLTPWRHFLPLVTSAASQTPVFPYSDEAQLQHFSFEFRTRWINTMSTEKYPRSSIEDDFNYGTNVATASIQIRMGEYNNIWLVPSHVR